MAGDKRTESGRGYVAVIGLGYVGLPLAATLAAHHQVVGVDANPAVRAALRAGRPPFFEPGLEPLLAGLRPGSLSIADQLPDEPPDAIVICVGTPVDAVTKRPDMRALEAAAGHVADHVSDETLVVIRSTVPVGTGRQMVLPKLREHVATPLLASCPERTIQGKAIAEIRSLPQIIGGIDKRSADRASALFAPVTDNRVVVSSTEAAEMIKLICNAHTDVIYGFGNEVALIADSLGLDAIELIEAANLGYPRPDLSRPGFVGGSCLTKDPYMLMGVSEAAGHQPAIIHAARKVNESIPDYIVSRVMDALSDRVAADAKVLVAGIAYKGRPETDDVRGAASPQIARELGARVGTLSGHDFVVAPDRIAALGYTPASLDEGLDGADALVLLTDHPKYGQLDPGYLLGRMQPDPVVFDMWGVLHDQLASAAGVTYLGLGRG